MRSVNDMPPPKLTKDVVAAAILGFEERKRGIDAQIAELRGFLAAEPDEPAAPPVSAKRPRRKVSAAGRKAMAEAQRKRWAAVKASPARATKTAPKPKRKLSAAGRAAIVAATKKMWAAKRAAAEK
jgi:hypothetical protein